MKNIYIKTAYGEIVDLNSMKAKKLFDVENEDLIYNYDYDEVEDLTVVWGRAYRPYYSEF